MKKLYYLISLTLISNISFGQRQHTEHFLTLTVSNNGQITDVMNDFYFSQGAYLPNNDVFNYKQKDVKYNLHYEYVTKNNFAFCGTVGYCNRKDTYSISNVTPANGSKEQNYLSIALDFKYVYKADRLQFSAGVEIPYYKISSFTEKIIWDSPAQSIHSTETIDGGSVYGLNTIYSGKFFFSTRFFLAADFTFGLLNFNLGKHYKYVIDYQNPVVFPDGQYQIDDSYKLTTISKPEFFFGIGIKL